MKTINYYYELDQCAEPKIGLSSDEIDVKREKQVSDEDFDFIQKSSHDWILAKKMLLRDK